MKITSYILLALGCCASSGAGASLLTPGGVCKASGFDKASPFHGECTSRVARERRSFFWREEGANMMVGAVAGVAASGGSAIGVFSRRPEPGVRRIEIDGVAYLVRLTGGPEATVRSAVKYKPVKQPDIPAWKRAAEVASGCSVTRQVRDIDALYLWLECGSTPAAAATPVAPAPQAAPVVAAAAPTGGSIADELAKLASMRERGLLTPEEFQAAKAKLLKD